MIAATGSDRRRSEKRMGVKCWNDEDEVRA
jgi:hypothetical protein